MDRSLIRVKYFSSVVFWNQEVISLTPQCRWVLVQTMNFKLLLKPVFKWSVMKETAAYKYAQCVCVFVGACMSVCVCWHCDWLSTFEKTQSLFSTFFVYYCDDDSQQFSCVCSISEFCHLSFCHFCLLGFCQVSKK